MKRNVIRLVTLPCALSVSTLAMAHTGSHEAAGFTAGISHPLMGLDHLAAMLAVGLWAALGLRQVGQRSVAAVAEDFVVAGVDRVDRASEAAALEVG